jgi:hypothetical protein
VSYELSSLVYFETRVDPDGKLAPAKRRRLALARYREAVAQAERDVAEIPDTTPEPDDWRQDAILIRVKAAAEATVPAGLILAASELVDSILEGAACANIRDTDVTAEIDICAVALAATSTAWAHAAERARE